MTIPRRIRRRRTKGYRMPKGARSVGRPGKWGNPFTVGDLGIPNKATAVERYREWLDERVVGPSPPKYAEIQAELRGHDLACWCGLCDRHKDGLPMGVKCPDCEPCHGDVLLEISNR